MHFSISSCSAILLWNKLRLKISSPTVPDIHCVLHDSHICLALGRRVDGQLSWRNDKAFAKWQPHAFSKSVCESETQKGKVNISETSQHVTKKKHILHHSASYRLLHCETSYNLRQENWHLDDSSFTIQKKKVKVFLSNIHEG